MDKLEQYLEQVCRRIGGPRSLRQHIREELRQHLRDAAAVHQAAGMSEAEALDRALNDFGGPDQVRSELEETHGHRLLPIVIDQAMRWKEMTMRARWLWTTWAYLATGAVILVDLLFIGFTATFWLPKLEKIYAEGWLTSDERNGPSLRWMYSFFEQVGRAWDQATWWLLVALAGWGLFEWRVRSENKPFMRLAGLGTIAVALTVVVAMTSAVMPMMFMIGIPSAFRAPQSLATTRLERIDSLVAAMVEAQAKQDWRGVESNAEQARNAIESLMYLDPAFMIPPSELKKDELRTQLTAAKTSLGEAKLAGQEMDAAHLDSAVQRFQRAYGSVRAAAKAEQK